MKMLFHLSAYEIKNTSKTLLKYRVRTNFWYRVQISSHFRFCNLKFHNSHYPNFTCNNVLHVLSYDNIWQSRDFFRSLIFLLQQAWYFCLARFVAPFLRRINYFFFNSFCAICFATLLEIMWLFLFLLFWVIVISI